MLNLQLCLTWYSLPLNILYFSSLLQTSLFCFNAELINSLMRQIVFLLSSTHRVPRWASLSWSDVSACQRSLIKSLSVLNYENVSPFDCQEFVGGVLHGSFSVSTGFWRKLFSFRCEWGLKLEWFTFSIFTV